MGSSSLDATSRTIQKGPIMKEFILLMIILSAFCLIDISCAKISSMNSKKEEKDDVQ